MHITSDIVYGFSGALLSSSFDNAQKTPLFHREMWEACCREDPLVAIAAPRGHAKSTAVSFAYATAEICFRSSSFVLLLSATESSASRFLGTIKAELEDNEELQDIFGIVGFAKSTETELIVMFDDGHKACVVARGWAGKIRGIKWGNKRPDLVICDDLEDDEAVLNLDRREKFRDTFFSVILPCMSDLGKIRLVGTILHFDALLARIMEDKTWYTLFYEAHNSDFSVMLWPEKFPRKRLERIRESYRAQGIPEKYSQEYLNNPIDVDSSYFRKVDMRDMTDEDKAEYGDYYTAVDFAISKADRADRTVITTVKFTRDGTIHVVDVRLGRWDSKEIIDEMFRVQIEYKPLLFTTERGAIEKSLGPFLKQEMFNRSTFMNLNPMLPVADKQARARSMQARMRMGGVKFDKQAEWYGELENELLTFPAGKHDDIVDSLAWVGLTLDKFAEVPSPKELEEEVWQEEYDEYYEPSGRSGICGY